MHTITLRQYKIAGQIFHWASAEHYKLWFTGRTERHFRTERALPRLVRNGDLVTADYGKKLVYAVPRMKGTPIAHGLGVTETIIRIHHSQADGTIIQERFFKGSGSVPDWGIQFGEKLLLLEYSTKNNFEQARILKTKLTKYDQNLNNIISKFRAAEAIVLFVLDVSRERVKNFVLRVNPEAPYYFTDYETFKSVPLGKQLTTPIYFWRDGEQYPLKK